MEQVWRGMTLIGSLRQLQIKKHYAIQLVLHTKLSHEPDDDDDDNLSFKEETCFTREVTKAIRENFHKKKWRRAYQSSSPDILVYRKEN